MYLNLITVTDGFVFSLKKGMLFFTYTSCETEVPQHCKKETHNEQIAFDDITGTIGQLDGL